MSAFADLSLTYKSFNSVVFFMQWPIILILYIIRQIGHCIGGN